MTLADSSNVGQHKQIVVLDVTNTVDVDLTTTVGAGVTYTFQTAGETMTIVWSGANGWAFFGINSNATVTNYSGTTTADIT